MYITVHCTVVKRTIVCTVKAAGASYITVHFTVVHRSIVCTVQAVGAS